MNSPKESQNLVGEAPRDGQTVSDYWDQLRHEGNGTSIEIHPVREIIERNLGDLQSFLSIPLEAEIIWQQVDNILNACEELCEKIAGLSESGESASILWYETVPGLNFRAIRRLNLIPADSCKRIAEQRIRDDFTYDKLQAAPLDIQTTPIAIEPDSDLEWMMFSRKYMQSVAQVSPREFVSNLAAYVLSMSDSRQRNREATEYLNQLYRKLSVVEGLDQNIPCVFSSKAADSRSATILNFGYELGVSYSKHEGLWHAIVKKGVVSESFASSNAVVSEGSVAKCDIFYFKTFSKLKLFLEEFKAAHLIKNGRLPVDARRVSPPPDIYGNGRAHKLYASNLTEPFSITKIKHDKFYGGHTIFKQGVPRDVVGFRLGSDNGYKLDVMFPKFIDRNSRAFGEIEVALKKANCKFCELTTNTGAKIVVLERPLGPFTRNNFLSEPEILPKLNEQYFMVGFQRTNFLEFFPIIATIELPVAASRFHRPPLEIRFDTVNKLPLNVELNRHPLRFDFDPALNELNFASDPHGHNGLLDLWDISIPHAKPSERSFDLPQLSAIKGLESVPATKWGVFLKSIEGDRVTKIALTELTERFGGKLNGKRLFNDENPEEALSDRIGESYKSPREKISIFGTWIVSHCSIKGMKYYVVDSPLYGNALYLFRYLEGAEKAAKHFNGKGIRAVSRSFPGFVRKINHTDGWQARLTEEINRSVIEKNKERDAPLFR